MKRLILILLLLITLPCLAAPVWRVTIKVEMPGSSHADSLKAHFIQHDGVQEDVWAILDSLGLGWAILDNDEGTQYFVIVSDTISIIGPIRSALGKYNKYVIVRKEEVEIE